MTCWPSPRRCTPGRCRPACSWPRSSLRRPSAVRAQAARQSARPGRPARSGRRPDRPAARSWRHRCGSRQVPPVYRRGRGCTGALCEDADGGPLPSLTRPRRSPFRRRAWSLSPSPGASASASASPVRAPPAGGRDSTGQHGRWTTRGWTTRARTTGARTTRGWTTRAAWARAARARAAGIRPVLAARQRPGSGGEYARRRASVPGGRDARRRAARHPAPHRRLRPGGRSGPIRLTLRTRSFSAGRPAPAMTSGRSATAPSTWQWRPNRHRLPVAASRPPGSPTRPAR